MIVYFSYGFCKLKMNYKVLIWFVLFGGCVSLGGFFEKLKKCYFIFLCMVKYFK